MACGLVYTVIILGPLWLAQMMTLGCLWPVIRLSQIRFLVLLYGEKMFICIVSDNKCAKIS